MNGGALPVRITCGVGGGGGEGGGEGGGGEGGGLGGLRDLVHQDGLERAEPREEISARRDHLAAAGNDAGDSVDPPMRMVTKSPTAAPTFPLPRSHLHLRNEITHHK